MDQRGFDNPSSEFLSARDAAKLLGVKLATLYSYAARGKIHSVPTGKRRAHVYRRADVERIKGMAVARSGHGAVAAGALQWGEPVMESEVSGISAQGPIYRGHLAVEFAARGVAFERAAELLWGAPLPERAQWAPPESLGAPATHVLALTGRDVQPVRLLLVALSALAAGDVGPLVPNDEADKHRARSVIRRLAAWLGAPRSVKSARESLKANTVAEALAVSLGASNRKRAAQEIDRALVLLADHELNASSFAARVAASARADLLACLAAGLATFSGPRHGGECDRVEALVDEVREPKHAARVLAARVGRGETIPGFGHRLYPSGDPRSLPLWDAAIALGQKTPRFKTLLAIAQQVESSAGLRPSVDFALVALGTALALPVGSATGIFAVARTAGWVAHSLEQRRSQVLLRPRARYVGPGLGVTPVVQGERVEP